MSEGPAGITVTVRCFSHLKQALGRDALELELPTGATAADAERALRELLPPQLSKMVLRVAVNRELVGGDTSLAEGDEVALLPPMQGGRR